MPKKNKVTKMKTNKAARKRFRVTKNKKVLGTKSHKRHMLTDRTPKKKRQNRGWHGVDQADAKKIIKMMPYGS